MIRLLSTIPAACLGRPGLKSRNQRLFINILVAFLILLTSTFPIILPFGAVQTMKSDKRR